MVGSIQESLNQLGNVSAQFRRGDRETLDALSLEVTRLGEMMTKMDVSGANLHQLEHDYQEMHGWVRQAFYKHERLEGEAVKMAMQAHEWDIFCWANPQPEIVSTKFGSPNCQFDHFHS